MHQFPNTFPVTCHTGTVGRGSTFVAIKGMDTDGAQYITSAINAGAKKVVVENDVSLSSEVHELLTAHNVAFERVDNTRKALAQLSAQAAGYPSKKLTIIGITGTKGKTTTAFLLYHFLGSAGYTAGLLSTVKNSINGFDMPALLTTPQPDYLHQFFAYAVKQGVTHIVMEVAAQAVPLHRIEGISFDAIIFTNFSLEHLEFYSSMEDYFASKVATLSYRKINAPAYINGDDPWCHSLLNHHSQLIPFGMQHKNDWRVDVSQYTELLTGKIYEPTHSVAFSCASLVGSFNAYNILGAYTAARMLGLSSKECVQALRTFCGVPGRLERYLLPNGAYAYIDYAHNPASFEVVLQLLREKTDHLIVLFGCGGGRDSRKRPLMGAVASQFADLVILTSDNPRHEDPQAIIENIKGGISEKEKVWSVLDREQAIYKAYEYSRTGTIIAILGKGPALGQIVGTQKIPYADVTVVQRLINAQ